MTSADMPLLRVEQLGMQYPLSGGWLGKRRVVHALDAIDLELRAGETLAVVGESGCGKSTLGKCILQLIEPTSGRVYLDGELFSASGVTAPHHLRQKMQVVFQDPYASLNPRRTIFQTVADPLRQAGIRGDAVLRERVRETLAQVGLDADFMDRHPHELSGGQRQRVAIARAIVLRPQMVVCDEPISSLDISIQAQVINLLRRLQRELGIAYLFITHDLRLVPRIADRVIVMYLGQVVEEGPAHVLERQRLHPYSQALFAASPRIDFDATPTPRVVLEGEVPSPMNPPQGCRFHTRCPVRQPLCSREAPQLRQVADRRVRCHFAEAPATQGAAP
jgi:oligopeptide/dipeptide ABC transporter ATP-binding protein